MMGGWPDTVIDVESIDCHLPLDQNTHCCFHELRSAYFHCVLLLKKVNFPSGLYYYSGRLALYMSAVIGISDKTALIPVR